MTQKEQKYVEELETLLKPHTLWKEISRFHIYNIEYFVATKMFKKTKVSSLTQTEFTYAEVKAIASSPQFRKMYYAFYSKNRYLRDDKTWVVEWNDNNTEIFDWTIIDMRKKHFLNDLNYLLTRTQNLPMLKPVKHLEIHGDVNNLIHILCGHYDAVETKLPEPAELLIMWVEDLGTDITVKSDTPELKQFQDLYPEWDIWAWQEVGGEKVVSIFEAKNPGCISPKCDSLTERGLKCFLTTDHIQIQTCYSWCQANIVRAITTILHVLTMPFLQVGPHLLKWYELQLYDFAISGDASITVNETNKDDKLQGEVRDIVQAKLVKNRKISIMSEYVFTQTNDRWNKNKDDLMIEALDNTNFHRVKLNDIVITQFGVANVILTMILEPK